MTRDINLDNRKTYIFVSDVEGVYPSTDLYPSPDLYPAGSNQMQLEGNIVAGTMTLEEMIVDSEISFGSLYSDKFECTLYDVPDMAGYFIYVYQVENNEIKYIFTGLVDSSKKNKDGYDRQIVAYDNAYRYGNRNVADWWNSFWTDKQTATILVMRQSLLSWLGIDYENISLPNDSVTVSKDADISVITFSTMIKLLCEINCCFPHFDRDGKLRFIVLDDESVATNIHELYEGENSEFEDYVTENITGIQFLDSDGKVKYEVGNTSNMYALGKDNMLLYSMGTSQLTTIGNNMLSYISNISYTPCSVKMICGDLDYELGKRIITGDGQEFYIMQNNYSGPQLVEQTMIAKGSQKQDNDARALQTSAITLNEKISRLTVNVEEFHTEYIDFTEDTASNFQQTANSISAEVTRATDAETSVRNQILVDIKGITLSTSVNGKTATISMSGPDGIQIDSDNITFNGLVSFTNLSTSGQTTINGGNITTGSIHDSNNNTVFNLTDGTLTIKKGSISLNDNNFQITTDGQINSKGQITIGGYTYDRRLNINNSNITIYGKRTDRPNEVVYARIGLDDNGISDRRNMDLKIMTTDQVDIVNTSGNYGPLLRTQKMIVGDNIGTLFIEYDDYTSLVVLAPDRDKLGVSDGYDSGYGKTGTDITGKQYIHGICVDLNNSDNYTGINVDIGGISGSPGTYFDLTIRNGTIVGWSGWYNN